jgi:3'-phosphoadenosine 5'-phosphosulfate (PAPS) 3'-phosphatase
MVFSLKPAKNKWLSAIVVLAIGAGRSTTALQIGPLFSSCVDACQRGCEEIRSVQARRDDGGILKVELKDENDSRSALTEADQAAQRVIIGSLRAEWGDELRIIGEEDDDGDALSFDGIDFKPLRKDIFEYDIEETAEMDVSEVTIYIDPLDGTREFVEGRLANCQVLVGVAIGGQSVMGAIGIPFPAGDMSTESTIVYGLADMAHLSQEVPFLWNTILTVSSIPDHTLPRVIRLRKS